MRTYALILATLGLIGGAFVFYWRAQPATLAIQDVIHVSPEPATKPTTTYAKIGPGARPWVRMIDSDGRVGSQYRAQEYLPQEDGTVRLVDVEGDFFLGQHQRLHVTGATGNVVMHGSGNLGLGAGAAQPSGRPSRGRLNDVKMTLVDETVPSKPLILLTMTTNNIEFDNETFLITTGGYTNPDGALIPPDQVPVEVRGEYDFDGRGLTVRWNDQDDRLELLEIAHGEELRINHPVNRNSPIASGDLTSGATPPVPTAAPPAKSGAVTTAPYAGGSANSEKAGAAVPPSGNSASAPTAAPNSVRKPQNKKTKPVYLATFEQAVRVTQGDQLLMTGDTMRLQFRMKESQTSSTTAQTHAAISSQDAPDFRTQQAVYPSRRLGRGRWPGLRSSICEDSASERVDAPPLPLSATGDPIVVRWTGKLRIIPDPVAPPRPIAPGDSIMELVGISSPVYVFRAGGEESAASEVRCAKLTYVTADGSALLEGSAVLGQVQLTRRATAMSMDEDPPAPTVITTDTLDYVAAAHTATLGGRGHAVIPVAQNPGDKPAVIDATWTKVAQFDFLPRAKDEMAIKAATFNGDVVIQHPQLKLTAQQLMLMFSAPLVAAAKPAAGQSPALSEVIALDRADHVHCELLDAAGKRQVIESQSLDLRTARTQDNRLLAQQVDAVGNVRASDASQTLTCDRMRMLLRPAIARAGKQPQDTAGGVDTSSVELDRLDARGRVAVISKDNSVARSDQLLVAMDPDGPHVMMTGDTLSRITDAKLNELAGEKIVIQPRQQLAHVIGSGTLHVVGEQGTAASANTAVASSRKMDVIFSDGADLDSAANQINLRGKVVATMPDSDGTINTAQSDRMRIDLRDKPKAVTQPSAPRAAPTTGPANETNLLGNKEARMITLDGNALVQSNLSDASGILRQFELKAPRILYAVSQTPDISAHTLVVPSAGVMLVRDHRPPSAAGATGGDDAGLGSGRGATAFRWRRRLTYDEDSRVAVLSGDVFVAHEADNAKELPVQLTADEVTAIFNPAGKKPSTPTRPAGSEALELRSMEAVGNVVVNRGVTQVNARRIYFEPASHWMTAQGTTQSPVTVLNDSGTQSSVDEVRWNTQTWDFAMKQAGGEARR